MAVKFWTTLSTVPIWGPVISISLHLLRSTWLAKELATDPNIKQAVTSWIETHDKSLLLHWDTGLGAIAEQILRCRCYVEVWSVLSVTDVPSIHWSQNKVSGNSLPYFSKLPCNFSNWVSIFEFYFQIFINYTKLLTSMTNTAKVTSSPFPMLAAFFLLSIATWNLLHYFKLAFDFPNSGFAVYLLLCFHVFYTLLYHTSLPNN